MKGLSALERWALLLTAGFLLFTGGYFLGNARPAQPYQITTADTVPVPAQSAPVQSAPAQSDDSRPDSLLPGERIGLNSASAGDLQRLPGIGEKRAQAILDWRAEHGPFRSVQQLLEVDGIGTGILDQISDYVSLE